MEPHRESTDGSNTCPASTLLSSYSQVFIVFFLQVQIPCYILISCATSQVRRAVSLSVVPVQHCCLEEDPPRPTISFPWPVLCVGDSLSLILVGHSKGKTHETMKRRQVHHTSTSNDFHAALFVDEYPRPSIVVCTIGNSLTLNTNLAEPPLSVQLWVNKLSKSYQHFLNLLVKEKQLWQVNVLSPSMPLYGTLSLFRTSSAGCYVFPCVQLGCDVSTCKPYAGIDTSIFKAHSVRSAATSSASEAGVTTATILDAADWATETVFQRFYYKPKHNTTFGHAVLSQLSTTDRRATNSRWYGDRAFWNIITEWLRPRSGRQLFWIIWRMWCRTYQRPATTHPIN